jgi:hypothetical protein
VKGGRQEEARQEKGEARGPGRVSPEVRTKTGQVRGEAEASSE